VRNARNGLCLSWHSENVRVIRLVWGNTFYFTTEVRVSKLQGGKVSVRQASYEVEQCSHSVKQRINRVSQALDQAQARREKRVCTVCGADAKVTRPHSVIPSSYIASCLVLNDMDAHFASLSLRCVWLCVAHRLQFSSLFIDVVDCTLDLERLERRAEVLGAVRCGQLVVFGGAKALKVVEEFHAEVVALKASVALNR
jgi:hypothetical protein